MELPLRRSASAIGILLLLVVALIALLSRAGSQDVAKAAPNPPFGEMTLTNFPGPQQFTTDIRDYSWGMTQTHHPGEGSGTTPRAEFKPFIVTRSTSPSSPKIANAMILERHFDKATIKIFKPGTSQVEGKYVLTKPVISRYDVSPGGGATEEIEFVYDEIDWFQGDNEFCMNIVNYEYCVE